MMTSMEAKIEICENERAWIGGGFSSKGLLPNDRKRYSSLDGSLSFHSIEEARDEFLVRGWSVVPNSSFEVSSDWYYARDFTRSAIAHCQKVRNRAFHWVRFRTLSCPIQLDPTTFLSDSAAIVDECEHGDSIAEQKISTRFVDVMTYLTLLVQPSGKVPLEDAVALPIKKRLLSVIDIQHERRLFTSPSKRVDQILGKLSTVAIEERRMAKYLLSKIGSFQNCKQEPLWSTRRSMVNERYWSEGSTIAGWILRMIDPEYEYHCGVIHCGSSCEFTWERCPNPGCSVIMSRKHLGTHSKDCSYQLIVCDCGESVSKHQMKVHLTDSCALRDTQCPFEPIGCSLVLQARHVPQHVEEANAAHLILAMNRIVEIQNVVRELNASIRKLQVENDQLKIALERSNERSESGYKGLNKSLDNTMKRVSGLENKTQKEFRSIKMREKSANEHG